MTPTPLVELAALRSLSMSYDHVPRHIRTSSFRRASDLPPSAVTLLDVYHAVVHTPCDVSWQEHRGQDNPLHGKCSVNWETRWKENTAA